MSADLVDLIHRQIVDDLDPGTSIAAEQVRSAINDAAPLLGTAQTTHVVSQVLARIEGIGPLADAFADPLVTDIMINGTGPIYVERNGGLEALDFRLDANAVDRLIERTVAQAGRRVDPGSPMVDARLADGSRVNVVVPPLALDGPVVTIRRFTAGEIDLDELCPPGVGPLLDWAVGARMNMVVSGGTGAGKTTLLNALSSRIDADQRIITVEDAAELRLPLPHVVRLESRPANIEGQGAVSIRELVRNALRMRPDRIIVGEVRGAEALDMLWAMNTGHEGSLSTIHANGPREALLRLEVMVLQGDASLPMWAVSEQIGAAVDLVVQIARTPTGRRVVDIGEVVVVDDRWTCRTLLGENGLARLPVRVTRFGFDPDPAWCVS